MFQFLDLYCVLCIILTEIYQFLKKKKKKKKNKNTKKKKKKKKKRKCSNNENVKLKRYQRHLKRKMKSKIFCHVF